MELTRSAVASCDIRGRRVSIVKGFICCFICSLRLGSHGAPNLSLHMAIDAHSIDACRRKV
eukprot:3426881-Amphidinium_carterae.3